MTEGKKFCCFCGNPAKLKIFGVLICADCAVKIFEPVEFEIIEWVEQ